jgi:hypothetical protein
MLAIGLQLFMMADYDPNLTDTRVLYIDLYQDFKKILENELKLKMI